MELTHNEVGEKCKPMPAVMVATITAERTSFAKKSGNAFNGNRNDDNVNVNQNNANNHNDNRAWRGSLKAYWLCVDFSQPPSILPTSDSFD